MAPPTSLDLTAALVEIAGFPTRNVCVQVTKRSEKTICVVLGGLLQVDSSIKAPQVVYLCAKQDRVKEIQHVVAGFVTDGGKITACTVTPTPLKGLKVEDQVVIGTSGFVKRWVTVFEVLDPTRIKSVVIDEADQMSSDQADDIRRILIQIGKSGINYQVILFSALSSEIVKSSAMKKVREFDNCFSIVLDKPSHRLNCKYQSSSEVTRNMITTLNDRLSKAGITGTIFQILSQTPDAPGDTFQKSLTNLINNTSGEEKRELLQHQNEYQKFEDGCVIERKKLHAHNVGIIKGQILVKATEYRELVAKVNGITGTIFQILSQTPDAPGDTFQKSLTNLINNTSGEEKRELLQHQNEYQKFENGCVIERKKLHAHNVGIIKGQILVKATEHRELVAKVNGIASSTDLISVEQVGRRDLPVVELDPTCRACMAGSSFIETLLKGRPFRISESDSIFHAQYSL